MENEIRSGQGSETGQTGRRQGREAEEGEGGAGMIYFWLSWYHNNDENGPFELHTPWWISGYRGNESTICAAVPATSEGEAKEIVRQSYDVSPRQLEWRFCEKKDDEPFTDRFPRAEWMKWDEAVNTSINAPDPSRPQSLESNA